MVPAKMGEKVQVFPWRVDLDPWKGNKSISFINYGFFCLGWGLIQGVGTW
jgi:hypothetical protein